MADYNNWPDKAKGYTMNDYINYLRFNKLSTGETALKNYVEARGENIEDYYFFTSEEIESKLGLKRNEECRY